MAFCTGCGKELQPSAQFCPSCGKKVDVALGTGTAHGAVTAQSVSLPQFKQPSTDLKNIILGVIALLAIALVIDLAGGSILTVLIAAALIAATYIYGYKKLEVQEYKTVETVLTVDGVLAAFAFGVTLVAGIFLAALLNLALAGLCYYGWKQIKTITGK